VETLTNLKLGDLKLIQARQGYRFSLDPILLARFVKVRKQDHIVDLGTGSAIIPLLLARIFPVQNLIGIELQPVLARRALRNVELNQLLEVVKIIQGDVRQIQELLPAGQTDLVVANPPYRQAAAGRVAPNLERGGARHELAGGLEDFVRAAAWLLKNGGRFGLVFLAERLPELLGLMRASQIEPKRLRMIHPRPEDPAKMILIEGQKSARPGLAVESPLFVYQGAGRDYTTEVLRMYGEVD